MMSNGAKMSMIYGDVNDDGCEPPSFVRPRSALLYNFYVDKRARERLDCNQCQAGDSFEGSRTWHFGFFRVDLR